MANHPIVHVEFPTNDPAKSGEFYGSLFGWKVTSDEQLQYTMFDTDVNPSGGFPKPEGGARAGVPLVYVYTDDIDATIAKAESLGGTIVSPKFEIPGVGWIGFFADPTGMTVGLITPPPGLERL